MALFSPADAEFLEAVARVAFANPFLPDRIELEREALGDEFQAGSPLVWSRRADVDESPAEPSASCRRALPRLLILARAALVDGKRGSDKELTLYEDVVLYVLYDRFRPQLQATVQPALEGTVPAKIAFWPDFKRAFEHYLSLPDQSLPSNYEPAHIFAGFFQVRRAFHHIFDYIVGQSLPTARLRAAVWQSIFTHDLRRYRRSLYNRMSDIATLISGPSGTGKELVARAVGLSRYIPFDEKKACFTDDFRGSFHAVNVSALSPTLIESELFGHAKGSFTGRHGRPRGLARTVQAARHGVHGRNRRAGSVDPGQDAARRAGANVCTRRRNADAAVSRQADRRHESRPGRRNAAPAGSARICTTGFARI